MNRKVIYVSYMRLSDKVERDWYISHLQAQGITVEFWDVVALLFGGSTDGSKPASFLRVPQTYQEIISLLSLPENNGSHFIMLVAYEGRTAELFRILSKFRCKMIFLAWGELPLKPTRNWKLFTSGLFSPLRLAKKFYYKLKGAAYKRLKLISPFEVVFAAGKVLMSQNHSARTVVPINLVDYDLFNRLRLDDSRLVEGRYVIFLDIYLPFQSDLSIARMRAVNSDNYYASLNRLFELIESKHRLKVVIAAHPKANYEAEQFKGRDIYYGQTPRLVKDSDFVISHHSTSISYAVLNLKPIVFIYTDEMADLYKHTVVSYLHDFAEYLDANLYNIDEITQGDQMVVGEVNKERYNDYKYNYLTTPESEHSTTQDIFFHQLFPAA